MSAADPAPEAAESLPAISRSELLRQLSFEPSRPHFTIGLLFLVLGLLTTVAVMRPSGDAALQTARTEDLVQILDGLSTRQQRLEDESARLTALQADLERGSTAEALAQSRQTLSSLQVLAGTTPVSGPGIRITITDPKRSIDAPVLIDAVQELRDAGAEAIQVGPARVVASTWFGAGPDGPVVNGQPLPSPIVITAIGDPNTMSAAMNIPGGLADTIRTRGADFASTSAQSQTISVTVPSTAK